VIKESAQHMALKNDSSTTEEEEVKQLLKAENERREIELAKSTAEEVQKLMVENESLEIDKKQLLEEKDTLVEENNLQKQQFEEASNDVCCVLM
jgi:hypothetical protein